MFNLKALRLHQDYTVTAWNELIRLSDVDMLIRRSSSQKHTYASTSSWFAFERDLHQ